MRIEALVHNRWMIAVRGALALGLALALLRWADAGLPAVVPLFAIYAIVDGVWSIAAAARVSTRLLDAWPVALEGAVSTLLGTLALVWPLIPRHFVSTLGTWGVVTGVLEVLAALALPRKGVHHWLLLTGGVSSLFLAVLVLGLPLADTQLIVRVLIAYAAVFGAAMLVSAAAFSRPPLASPLAGHRHLASVRHRP